MSEKFYKLHLEELEALSKALNKTDLCVYLTLRSINPFSDKFKKIEVKAIMQSTNMSEPSVKRSLQHLHNAKLITKSDDGYSITGDGSDLIPPTDKKGSDLIQENEQKINRSNLIPPQNTDAIKGSGNMDNNNGSDLIPPTDKKGSDLIPFNEIFASHQNLISSYQNLISSHQNLIQLGSDLIRSGSDLIQKYFENPGNKELQTSLDYIDYIDYIRLNKTFLDWSEEKNNLNFQVKKNGVNKIEEKMESMEAIEFGLQPNSERDSLNQINLSESKQGLSQKQEDVGKDKLVPQVEQSTEIVAVKEDPFFGKAPQPKTAEPKLRTGYPKVHGKPLTKAGGLALTGSLLEYVAKNMFVKEFGNTEDQAFANATNYLRNDVNRLPIQWEAYQHHSFKAAASIQSGTQATGVIKEADVAKLESVSSAFQQMPEHLQVTDKPKEFTPIFAQTKAEDALPPASPAPELKAIEAIVTPVPVVAIKQPSSAEEYLQGLRAVAPPQEEEATPEQKAEFFKAYRQMLFKGVGKKMDKPKEDRKTSQIDQWRADIHDPILRAKVVKEINASGQWYVEYNENGYPTIRENNDFIPEFPPELHQEDFFEVEALEAEVA